MSSVKVGIMQPYFLPYLGYWQLMGAVDRYVIYDDVNYIKGGWINRNRMLTTAGGSTYFTLPLEGAGSFKKINEIGMLPIPEKILKGIHQVYAKAPQFKNVSPLIDDIFSCSERNLARFLVNSIRSVALFLGFKTELIVSSSLSKDNSLHAEDKVRHICKLLGATNYYNAIGGQELYSKEHFASDGICLSFLKTTIQPYEQFEFTFQPGLSILDVLMFNSPERVRAMLTSFELV